MKQISGLAILKKTAAGRLAFTNHAIGIEGRARRLFVLADGTRTVEDLLIFAQSEAAGLAVLKDMVDQHYLELTPPHRPSADSKAGPLLAASESNFPKSAEATHGSWVQQSREASRWLEDKLGPAAQSLCIALEKAVDASAHQQQLLRCAVAVEAHSKKLGIEFKERFLD
jgi:hypothetical protein